jgi:hypothetical protein
MIFAIDEDGDALLDADVDVFEVIEDGYAYFCTHADLSGIDGVQSVPPRSTLDREPRYRIWPGDLAPVIGIPKDK